MSNDRNRDVSEAYSSSGSAQSNFSASAAQQQSRQSYAPGTGAAFMAQSGWTNRDEYGRPRQSSTTVFPVFTPAPRPPIQLQRRPFGSNNGVQRGESILGRQPHEVTFSEAPNYKKVYLIALIIVTVLLISLIALIVILLATKVFIYNVAQPPPSTVSPTSTTVQIPVVFPPPFSPPQLPPPQPPPHLVTRTFECEFFILDQANQAYDNANSFEQYQAQTIIQNALVTTFEGSSLRDMNPTIGLEKLENSGSDLRIIFRLSIVVLEQNPGLRELTIKNLLLSEAGTLEGLLNRTSLDRNRVSVKPISKKMN